MLSRLGADEHGFTLVELLVAMLSGIVIMFATFAIIDLTLRDNGRISDRLQATNLGRTFLDQTVAELNSGCLIPDVSPIQPVTPTGITPSVTTDATHLVFVSGMGDGQTNTPTLHVLSYASNTLTDTSYAGTGGTGPTLRAASTWTFSTTSSTGARVLRDVTAFVLSYYSFGNPSDSPANSLSNPAVLTMPLGTTWPRPTSSAEYNHPYQIARVDLAVTNGPDLGDTRWGGNAASVRDNLATSVVFRLTPPSTATNYPCD